MGHSNPTIGLPAGFRDSLHDEARGRRNIEARLAGLFESAGYGEILPSGVEFFDVYVRGHQSVRDAAFKFLDRNDHLLALRADFTPAIARIVASGALGESLPYRLWYAGSVYRKADLHRGRFHELRQVGAELIGVNGIPSDAEILDLAFRCLDTAGVTDAQLHVNHAGIFRGIIGSLGLGAEALRRVREDIDRKDMRRVTAFLESQGVDSGTRTQLDAVCRCVGGIDVLGALRPLIKNHESLLAMDDLTALSERLPQWRGRIVFDLTEIDELEYYTGMMAAFFSPRSNAELGKGGRYDALLREYGRNLPAVGFSFDVDRLAGAQ
jgi:ATP phosphoribosyltransferase regulatory subunit